MSESAPTPEHAAAIMTAYSEDAVEYARQAHQVDLDYSEGSLADVERILAELHGTLPKGFLARLFGRGPSAATIEQMAKMFGGYVGEVIRRQCGGHWDIDTAIAPGQLVYTLRIGEAQVFPPSKVHKRIVNGAEDNIVHYYRVLKGRYVAAQ